MFKVPEAFSSAAASASQAVGIVPLSKLDPESNQNSIFKDLALSLSKAPVVSAA